MAARASLSLLLLVPLAACGSEPGTSAAAGRERLHRPGAPPSTRSAALRPSRASLTNLDTIAGSSPTRGPRAATIAAEEIRRLADASGQSAARIRELDAGAQVVVVGHEPALSGLGAVLTARPDFPALRKAQAARLDDVAALRQEGRGPMELQWTFGFADDAATPHV